ncbi:hypothetical protein LTR10_021865 [Elasticomyces elasticus]|uniref:Uncharacterized protein n=1 Tax=Exophiala sideris TaxID=1016849 RepID=A0ABR0JQF7_9EURO|nr:hypothetical protein LTR10_021865 [Elasticomyces elasticus]KAK5039824.1 hypothetical protein LTS07_000319 [Exophiala sideris]KAK5041376.1 hypothetical protein LTR13_002851 [Exophiala sideris]KAK5068203.1 hypothetical protein LTR69_000321 [Exophiala sideris]KAK5187504.1 hypothetical protein LTR44_000320 [Eurotiomycetes sp. CCFEE 6388]
MGTLAPINWFIPIVVTLGGMLVGKAMQDWSEDTPGTPEATVVRIWAGMAAKREDRDLASLRGNSPQVVLFDEFGDYIGDTTSVGAIGEGGFQDFTVTPRRKGNNIRPTYLQINANGIDALCISAIQVSYADGGSSTIFGDVPTKFCGFLAYASSTHSYVTGSEGQKEKYRPWCMWIDENDSGNGPWEGSTWTPTKHFSQSVNFHIPDFDGQPDVLAAYNQSRDLLCNSEGRMQGHPWWPKTIAIFDPPLTYGNNVSDVPLVGGIPDVSHEQNNLDPKIVIDDFVGAGKWPQSSEHPYYLGECEEHFNEPRPEWCATQSRRRAVQESRGGSGEKLWALFDDADDLSLSADYVCSQLNFVGPHYANAHERKFCNLDDRTVWPFCDDTHTTNCFDTESHTLWGDTSPPASGSFGTWAVGTEAIRTPLLSLAGRSTLGL